MTKIKPIYWLGKLSLLWILDGWVNHSEPQKDPVHQAALEARLLALQEKKTQLEEIPGSLDKQRQYQARIDRLAHRLGHPPVLFDHKQAANSSVAPSPTSSPAFHEETHEVDYFHDRSQIVAVDHSLQTHGGVHPQASLLEELPRTNISRMATHRPLKGVIIDGDQKAAAPSVIPAMAPMTTGQLQNGEAGQSVSQPPVMGMTLSPHMAASPGETPHQGAALPQLPAMGTAQVSPAHTSENLSSARGETSKKEGEQGLSFPAGRMPTPLWKQTATQQEYANKAGWSVAPPPIAAPLFYAPPPAFAAMGRAGSVPQMEKAADPRLSFSPQKLMRLWR